MKGKSFLITQPMIHGLNGSTTVTLELADYLMSEGDKVVVYTYYYDNPAKQFFEEAGVEVCSAQDEPVLRLDSFDYIWVHSQALPVSIVEDLGSKLPAKIPRFIFNHMSPFDWIPDERPYIYNLEDRLSTLSLFVSQETLDEQASYFEEGSPKGLFRNPAPVVFSKMKYTPRKKLKHILIVSNHPPEELIDARKRLIKKGYKVVSFGELSEEYRLITPDVIKGYDVIVTIGKTVQYGLVAGVPVYIYDHFGGNGYLNEDNYELATRRNFSGRDGMKRDAQYITDDIIGGYQDAMVYATQNRSRFIDEFSINKVLPPIIESVKDKRIEQFSSRYASAVKSAQVFGKIRFEEGALSWNLSKANNSLRHDLEDADRARIDALEARDKIYREYRSVLG